MGPWSLAHLADSEPGSRKGISRPDQPLLIADEMALLELRRLVGLLEGKERFPEIEAVELPNEGRELSLDDFCERYLVPLAAELFRQRNPALAHPEWV